MCVGGVVIFNWQGRPFLYPPNDQLGQAKMIAKEALAKAEGKPFNFCIGDGRKFRSCLPLFF